MSVIMMTILRQKLRWVGWGSLLRSFSMVEHVTRSVLLGQKLSVIMMTMLRQKLSSDGMLMILGIFGRVPGGLLWATNWVVPGGCPGEFWGGSWAGRRGGDNTRIMLTTLNSGLFCGVDDEKLEDKLSPRGKNAKTGGAI